MVMYRGNEERGSVYSVAENPYVCTQKRKLLPELIGRLF